MIEVREARYFLAVVQTLHFGRAAELLGMSQPPLSQAIAQLERRLGVRLLDRSTRKVELTQTGHAFAAECRTVVAAAQRAQEVATQAEAGLAGTLRIGVVTSALGEPLLTTIRTFQQRRPQVRTRVVEVDTPAGQLGLLRRDIDVAVVRLSAPVRHLRTQPWRRDSYVVALPADHPAAATTGPADLARFADEPWVWLRREISPDYHDQLMATCRQAGFTPDMRHIANSIATQLAMVACGLGVTLVPSTAARSAVSPAAAYRPLTSRTELVELSLVTRDSPHEPLVSGFVRIALEGAPASNEATDLPGRRRRGRERLAGPTRSDGITSRRRAGGSDDQAGSAPEAASAARGHRWTRPPPPGRPAGRLARGSPPRGPLAQSMAVPSASCAGMRIEWTWSSLTGRQSSTHRSE